MNETRTNPANAGEARERALTVAFLIDRWEPARGGAERWLADFAAHLLARGVRVFALARSHARDAPGEAVRVRARRLGRAWSERALARALVAKADELGVDVTIGLRHLERVDLFWPHGGVMRPSLAARAAARGKSANAAIRGRFRTFVALERALLEGGGARRIVCVSKLVLDEFAREYPSARARLVRCDNGVDLERFDCDGRAAHARKLRAKLRLPSDAPVLGFLARDAELKGLAPLLEALAKLRARPWTLIAAGAKSTRAFERRARSLELAERVRFVGDVDALALWSCCDLALHPTFRDTFGSVIAEALACGVPVVTTRAAGASALVRSPEHGSVLERADDVDALASAIDAWLARLTSCSTDRLRVRAAVAGRSRSDTLRELEALVRELARRRANTTR